MIVSYFLVGVLKEVNEKDRVMPLSPIPCSSA